MKFWIGLLILVLSSLTLSIIFSFVIATPQEPLVINLTCPQDNITTICPSIPEPICNTQCPIQKELPLFMKEAANVAEAHRWQSMQYMCGEFSIELMKRLKADGYRDVRICEGILLNCDRSTNEFRCRHYWIKIGESIIIESITGEIISPDRYEREYDEDKCHNSVPSYIRDWVNSYGKYDDV